MEYLIGVIIGCIATTIIFWLMHRKDAKGIFMTTTVSPMESTALSIKLKTLITEDTKTIILKKSRR